MTLSLRLEAVQRHFARISCDKIKDKYNIPIEISNIEIKNLNEVTLENVLVFDQHNDTLLFARKAMASIEPAALTEGALHINTLLFENPIVRLNRLNADEQLNIQFILDNLDTGDKSNKTTGLRINQLLINNGRFSYDVISEEPVPDKLDPNHIDIRDFSCNLSLKNFDKKNLNLYIRSIKGNEKSGLEINRIKARITTKNGGVQFKGLLIELPGSQISSDSIEISNFGDNLSMASIDGELHSKYFSFKDIAPIFPQFNIGLPELEFKIAGSMNCKMGQGYINIATTDYSLTFQGETLIKNPYSREREVNMRIDTLILKENAIEELTSLHETLPQGIASKFGDTGITGNVAFSSRSLDTQIQMMCQNGHIDAKFSIDSIGNYTLAANGRDIHLGRLILNPDLKECDIKATSKGNIRNNKRFADFSIVLNSLKYKGYAYSGIKINGKAGKNGGDASLLAKDPNLAATLQVNYTKGESENRVEMTLNVDSIIPHNLNLISKHPDNVFSFKLEGKMTEYPGNKSLTSIEIRDFIHKDNKEDYKIKNIYIYDDNTDNERAITINSDILTADLIGDFNTLSLYESIAKIANMHMPSLQMQEKRGKLNNNYFYKIEVKDSRIFTKLLDFPFTINERSSISGSCHDADNTFNINAELNNINIGNTLLRTIEFKGTSSNKSLILDAKILKPTIKDKNKFNYHDTENDVAINLYSTISNDTIESKVDWNNNAASSGSNGMLGMNLALTRDKRQNLNFNANIAPSHFKLNGQDWHITPGSIIGNDEKFVVENIQLSSQEQSLKIHGTAGKFIDDSLSIELNKMDISTILDLVNFKTFKFSGKASGKAYITSLLHSVDANGHFLIDSLFVDEAHMGKGDLNIGWMNYNKTLSLDCDIQNDTKISNVSGFLSQPKDTIMLKIEADGLNLGFLGKKIDGFISETTGTANGTVYVLGPWSRVDLIGAAALHCNLKVKANNTTYRIEGDTLYMSPASIYFDNVGIKDKFGNKGILTGSLDHRNFSNWKCDLNVIADNMLVYDTYGFDNDPFYGTVFATGTANINSQGNGLTLKANLRSEPNSSFTYNSTAASGAHDNSFITFTDSKKNSLRKEAAEAKPESTYSLANSKVNLDFMIDVTETFHIKVYTNLKTDDYIDFYGRGTINALYDEKSGFSMKGSLNLDRGTYKFTIQDIFPKEFNITSGSTLAFDGDPFKAGLDLKTKHLVPSASLSDLTTEATNKKTVKVNCVMDITGTLENPTLNFDLELPEGSEEEKELLASVASTQEQKNMQFIYLLGVGKFYTYDYNNTGSDNQSSTAMESLISNTLSGQLNNMLGQIIDNDNWDISGNFSTSERGWNRMEVEGMLRGRLLDNRLLINGNFGYRDNPIANNSFIGDFEIQWLLNKKGNINLKAYSKTNDRYFSKTNLTTQGAGILFKHDFNKWRWWKKDEEE